jgi:hypothetical protein
LLEDGKVTPTEYALIHYVGEAGERDGISTTPDMLAGLLGDVSKKTIHRALQHLAEQHLVENDLRQGQRTPFRVWLGSEGRVETATLDTTSDTTSDSTSDTTSDTDPLRHVRSDFGRPPSQEMPQTASTNGLALVATSDSRARARKTETETESESEKEQQLQEVEKPFDQETEQALELLLQFAGSSAERKLRAYKLSAAGYREAAHEIRRKFRSIDNPPRYAQSICMRIAAEGPREQVSKQSRKQMRLEQESQARRQQWKQWKESQTAQSKPDAA